MSNTTKSSFYNGNDTVYTDTNPPGPSDAPMTSPDGAARSSFYERSGQQYAAIDLADQSVADVENNAALATMMEAYAQSAAGVVGAFARKAQSAWSAIQASIGTVEARLAAYVASAAQAVRKANSAASVAESSSAAHAAIAAAYATKARRTVEEAAGHAQSAIAARVAEASAYAKKALQDYSGSQSVIAALTTIRGAAEMAMRQAKQYAATAELSYQNAMAAVSSSWGWAKRAASSAVAAASSASGAAASASAASTSATNAANSAASAASSAATLTDDQIAFKAQVFN